MFINCIAKLLIYFAVFIIYWSIDDKNSAQWRKLTIWDGWYGAAGLQPRPATPCELRVATRLPLVAQSRSLGRSRSRSAVFSLLSVPFPSPIPRFFVRYTISLCGSRHFGSTACELYGVSCAPLTLFLSGYTHEYTLHAFARGEDTLNLSEDGVMSIAIFMTLRSSPGQNVVSATCCIWASALGYVPMAHVLRWSLFNIFFWLTRAPLFDIGLCAYYIRGYTVGI